LNIFQKPFKINDEGQILMINPFKGHPNRRFVERKYPYDEHFVGYKGSINPQYIFRNRSGPVLKTRPVSRVFPQTSRHWRLHHRM